MKKKLLIIQYDDLSEIVKKGEIVKRYYNPKNFFDEIHFILINQKSVSKNKLKEMAGKAKVSLNYINLSFIEKILLLTNLNIKFRETLKFLNIVKKLKPNVVRCYNINFNIFLAYLIKQKFKIPYLISLHCDYKDEIRKLPFYKKLIYKIISFKIKKVFLNSFKILPVYSSAVNLLKEMKIKNYKICYNFINTNSSVQYLKNKNLNLICTNRQFKEKNPINIIKAVEYLNDVKLTLIGDGRYHEKLKNYVFMKKLNSKINFIKNIKNKKYLSLIKKYDILIIHTNLQEFGKSVIEAMSVKIPIIINKPRYKISELSNKFCLLNSNTPEAYKKSILYFKKNKEIMKKMGSIGYKTYVKKYKSEKAETKFFKLYRIACKIN